ncbi:MAG: hypothetical protein K5707_09705, partial [Clostridia bacterium]|nr:hypothetical protein [Clostridia bacterium]
DRFTDARRSAGHHRNSSVQLQNPPPRFPRYSLRLLLRANPVPFLAFLKNDLISIIKAPIIHYRFGFICFILLLFRFILSQFL